MQRHTCHRRAMCTNRLFLCCQTSINADLIPILCSLGDSNFVGFHALCGTPRQNTGIAATIAQPKPYIRGLYCMYCHVQGWYLFLKSNPPGPTSKRIPGTEVREGILAFSLLAAFAQAPARGGGCGTTIHNDIARSVRTTAAGVVIKPTSGSLPGFKLCPAKRYCLTLRRMLYTTIGKGIIINCEKILTHS